MCSAVTATPASRRTLDPDRLQDDRPPRPLAIGDDDDDDDDESSAHGGRVDRLHAGGGTNRLVGVFDRRTHVFGGETRVSSSSETFSQRIDRPGARDLTRRRTAHPSATARTSALDERSTKDAASPSNDSPVDAETIIDPSPLFSRTRPTSVNPNTCAIVSPPEDAAREKPRVILAKVARGAARRKEAEWHARAARATRSRGRSGRSLGRLCRDPRLFTSSARR